ncbi:hypothetical protein GAR06_05213 [Micromonospora saelicesensis]|uniref:hypothetical protein n=1 Tax=Micromonospora saelicesensis TaxID=285676 RepID=UPI000DC27538|nr:hypothetical protein [Micromonospora saelicesensis]RAO42290.1 hypothetical protein GAR06_05213 [Micromonospora saelicesensis]
MTNSIHRVAAGLAAVTVLAVALTGCGGGASSADKDAASGDVASLVTPSAPVSATPAGGAANGRPQLRLDMTDEEEERLWGTYNICLHDNGVKLNDGRSQPGPVGDGTGLSLDQSGEPKAAYVACANKLPLQPPELDPEKNPNYVSQWNDYVQCLRGRGMKIHSLPDGSGWTYDDGVADPAGGLEGPALATVERECTMEIFGAQK